MRICLDGRVIGGELSGIPRLALNLITRLIEFGTEHEFIVLIRPGRAEEYIRPRENTQVIEVGAPPYSLREQYRIPVLLRKLKCDLYHCFTYAAPVVQVCRTIVAIHDLIQLEFPKYLGLVRTTYVKHVTGVAARRCWRIVTLSDYSRSRICFHFGVPAEKVSVVPAAVDPCFFAGPATRPRGRIVGGEYILNVGNRSLHKNVAAAVRVLKRIESKCRHKLVLVGEQNRQVVKLIERLGLKGRVIIRENVSDEELIELYRGADVFVFPSLCEGFGMTPLEAMACGAPTVSSDAASLIEVLGDAAVILSPHDTEGMAEAVLKIIGDSEFRRQLVQKGIERARMFTWDDSVRKILEIYKEASALP